MKLMKHIADAGIALVLTVLLIGGLRTWMPILEGTFWPVAEVVDVRIEQLTPREFKVSGDFVKFRDCDYLGLLAEVKDDITGEVIPVIVKVGTTVKKFPEGGEFSFGPWEVELATFAASFTLSFYNTHDCSGFWPVRTLFLERHVRTRLPKFQGG